MASKSVVTPVDLEPKAPFSKGIILLVVAIAAGCVLVAAFLGNMATSGSSTEEKNAVDVNPFTEGTSRSITSEWEALVAEDKKPKIVQKNDVDKQEQSTEVFPLELSRGQVNRPQSDIVAQGEVSAISIIDDDAPKADEAGQTAYSLTPEQKIADLLPKRLSEEQAFIKSAQLAAAMQGSGASAGFADQSSPSPLATKTKRFMNELGGESHQVLRKNSAPGKWVITAGKTIPAVTRRSQNSDLPCAVEATTSVDVYDSYSSSRKLIPKGSELIGVCSNDIAYGQNRILSVFTRLILPNGEWFDLSGAVGMDRTGATGMRGAVDNHFFQMFSSAFLIAFIADRVDNKPTSNNTFIGNAESAKSAAGQVLVDTSEFMLNRNKQIQPTIDVEAGRRVYVQVKHDMVFD